MRQTKLRLEAHKPRLTLRDSPFFAFIAKMRPHIRARVPLLYPSIWFLRSVPLFCPSVLFVFHVSSYVCLSISSLLDLERLTILSPHNQDASLRPDPLLCPSALSVFVDPSYIPLQCQSFFCRPYPLLCTSSCPYNHYNALLVCSAVHLSVHPINQAKICLSTQRTHQPTSPSKTISESPLSMRFQGCR